MYERFARAVLGGKLIFGDEVQVRAKRLLRSIEPARGRLASCEVCCGRGFILRGRRRVPVLCRCVAMCSPDVLEALGVDVPRSD